MVSLVFGPAVEVNAREEAVASLILPAFARSLAANEKWSREARGKWEASEAKLDSSEW